jgi:carboxymethylenebutenolidase
MDIHSRDVEITTPGGRMPALLCVPRDRRRAPAVVVLMEAFGLTGHMRDVTARLAREGYVTLAPDLFWRSLPDNTFGYDQVPQAVEFMRSLRDDDVVADIGAALGWLEGMPDVGRIGVTGFCMGGGFTFLAACTMSHRIAAAAPFYGMVRDTWIDAVDRIMVPMHIFFGGKDTFIPAERVLRIEERFAELGKPCRITVYPDADHGFFCDERPSYHPSAARDSWRQLLAFFGEHLAPPT